jgi:hypothetical protein
LKPEQLEVATPGPGQCLLHNISGRLFVERADPVVAIAEAMVRQVRAGHGHPDCTMDGDTLVISGANQQVTYRLGPSGHPGYLLGRAC